MGNITFASKVHRGVRSNVRVAKKAAISLLWGGGGGNQADVCYYINLPVDMGVNMGMYNGITSRHSLLINFNPSELRRESIRHLCWVKMKQKTTVAIWSNVRLNGRVTLRGTVV